MNKQSKAAASLFFAGALLSLAACSSSSQHAGNVGSVRSNPTPAMHTLAQRSSDRANMHAYKIDTDFRSFHSDIDRAFYMDRPSRLHNNIKPY